MVMVKNIQRCRQTVSYGVGQRSQLSGCRPTQDVSLLAVCLTLICSKMRVISCFNCSDMNRNKNMPLWNEVSRRTVVSWCQASDTLGVCSELLLLLLLLSGLLCCTNAAHSNVIYADIFSICIQTHDLNFPVIVLCEGWVEFLRSRRLWLTSAHPT